MVVKTRRRHLKGMCVAIRLVHKECVVPVAVKGDAVVFTNVLHCQDIGNPFGVKLDRKGVSRMITL